MLDANQSYQQRDGGGGGMGAGVGLGTGIMLGLASIGAAAFGVRRLSRYGKGKSATHTAYADAGFSKKRSEQINQARENTRKERNKLGLDIDDARSGVGINVPSKDRANYYRQQEQMENMKPGDMDKLQKEAHAENVRRKMNDLNTPPVNGGSGNLDPLPVSKDSQQILDNLTGKGPATDTVNYQRKRDRVQKKLDDRAKKRQEKINQSIHQDYMNKTGMPDLTQDEALSIHQKILKNKEAQEAMNRQQQAKTRQQQIDQFVNTQAPAPNAAPPVKPTKQPPPTKPTRPRKKNNRP